MCHFEKIQFIFLQNTDKVFFIINFFVLQSILNNHYSYLVSVPKVIYISYIQQSNSDIIFFLSSNGNRWST